MDPAHFTSHGDSDNRKAYARSGISFAPDWQSATDEAIDDVICFQPTAPDLIITFISTAWSDAYDAILGRVRTATNTRHLIGSSSSGVIAGSVCHESSPGITMLGLWLPGATLHPRYIRDVPDTWPWAETISRDDTRGVMLFTDPFRTDAQAALVGLRKTCPGVPMVGGFASTGKTIRKSWVFLDGHVHDSGAVAIALEGPYDILVEVSQGGTPVGSPWTITEIDHNQIITISNRPALDVMHETLDDLAKEHRDDVDLLIGFPMDEYQDTFSREDFVARGIMGTQIRSGSIIVGGIPRQGQTIQFLARDPLDASIDLHRHLQTVKRIERPIVAAILSTCKGRGTNMFGRNDHDAAAVSRALPDVPMVGLYSLGELGPVSGVPAYNAFAVSLGLIVER